MRKKGTPITTTTSLVMEALTKADDFMTAGQLATLVQRPKKPVFTALWALKTLYKAVDSVESGGSLWWFVTNEDQRMKVIEERVPEDKPRRAKRAKVTP